MTSEDKPHSNPTGPGSAQSEGLATGTLVENRYLIERELGRGGIGAVYLAHDKQLASRPVVVKVLLDESLDNDWIVNKFRHEIDALSRVDHPNIVGILDAGEMGDGKPYIVMHN